MSNSSASPSVRNSMDAMGSAHVERASTRSSALESPKMACSSRILHSTGHAPFSFQFTPIERFDKISIFDLIHRM